MKKIYAIILAVLCGVAARAQSDTPTTNAPAAEAPRAPTLIDSQSADFDLAGRKATYRGRVRVDDPQMKLTCEWLVADLPQSGGRVDHILAETNVVINSTNSDGQPMHATSDRAVYVYEVKNGATNETVTLTGHAKVENAQGWLTGEPIFWDRASNLMHAENQHMIFRQNFNGGAAKTNSPPVKTNIPPGSIDNIDKNLHISSPP